MISCDIVSARRDERAADHLAVLRAEQVLQVVDDELVRVDERREGGGGALAQLGRLLPRDCEHARELLQRGVRGSQVVGANGAEYDASEDLHTMLEWYWIALQYGM